CLATYLSSSSSYSNKGNSVIQTNLYSSLLIISNFLATSILKAPRESKTTDCLSATNNSKSPELPSILSPISEIVFSLKNLLIGDEIPSSPILIQANPFAL